MSETAPPTSLATYLRLLGYVRPWRGRLLLAFLAMVVLAASEGLQTWLIGPLLQLLVTGGREGGDAFARFLPWFSVPEPNALLAALPALIVALSLIKGGAQFAQFYFMATTGQKVVAALRLDLFRHMIGLSPAHFARRHSGEVLSHFGADLSGVETAVTYAAASAVRDTLRVITLLGVAFLVDWRLALIACGAVPLGIWPLSRLVRRLKRSTRQMQESAARISERIAESFGSLKVVQAFGAEAHEAARFEKEIRTLLGANRRSIVARGLGPPIGELLAGVGLAFTVWYGAQAVSSGDIRAQDLFSVLAAVLMLYQPIRTLGSVGPMVVTAAAGGERVFRVLDERSEVHDAPGATDLGPFQRSIRFEEVSFRYGPPEANGGPAGNVLDRVSFELRRGEVVALVGKSGAGKTTLANLLARFWDPTGGRITIDGRDLREVTLQSLRRQLAVVTQETLLFRDTVRANVAYGKPDATEEEIRAAARRACAEEFIAALPEGYDTVLGERGHTLSGGQRQRLAIARALLRDAPILILDEATSSLDAESERAVQEALEHLMEGRTVLVIAHRLSTVQRADRIVVLRDGRVVEEGRHAELLAARGEYRRLYDLQLLNMTAPEEEPARAARSSC